MTFLVQLFVCLDEGRLCQVAVLVDGRAAWVVA